MVSSTALPSLTFFLNPSPGLMATDTQNPEPDNRHKTLTLTPINPPDFTDESTNPSSNAKEDFPELQSQSATVNPDEGTEKKEVNDAKVKGTTQAPNSVVSPTGDSGPIDDTQKKLRRAERFGVPVQLSEKEKRNSRAERFGTSTGSETSKASEEQKRKARAERFGLPVPVDEAKKKARLAKFESDVKIDTQEEEKRKARAIRFSQPPSNVPHINCEGDVGQKTAIVGEAAGGV